MPEDKGFVKKVAGSFYFYSKPAGDAEVIIMPVRDKWNVEIYRDDPGVFHHCGKFATICEAVDRACEVGVLLSIFSAS